MGWAAGVDPVSLRLRAEPEQDFAWWSFLTKLFHFI